jgi:hypothetical protein
MGAYHGKIALIFHIKKKKRNLAGFAVALCAIQDKLTTIQKY